MRSLPAMALLSNGSYGVMITSAGAGYSTWRDLDVTRWHRSATYRIRVDNAVGAGRGVRSVELDGRRLPTDTVPLTDDGQAHNVRVQLG